MLTIGPQKRDARPQEAVETLRRGDYVEIKSPEEILRTLDSDGAINHVPFMPEMIAFCGGRYRIARRVVTTCVSGTDSPRSFYHDDVYTLEDLRCSGAAHGGCQKACAIYWRQAWLRKVERPADRSQPGAAASTQDASAERLRAALKVSTGPNTYFCQASEFVKDTFHLATARLKVASLMRQLSVGNFTLLQMARILWIWLIIRIRWAIKGVFAQGRNKSTPNEGLNLRAGEWVEIKPMQEILQTLNEQGMNRGLQFNADMGRVCGRRYRVNGRLENFIADCTGEMRHMRNTVCLENSFCGCVYLGGLGRGACARNEYVYWREIWLRRVG